MRRLLLMPVLLLGIVTLTFVVSRTVPAAPLASIVGERQLHNEQVVAAAKARWGLDKSLPEQYVIYVTNLLRGDLGTSFRTKSPVADDLLRRLPATLELTLAAMLFAVSVGVVLGMVAALKRDSWVDHVARLVALIGSSIPVFWAGLIALFIFYGKLGILPGPGRLDPQRNPPPELTGLYTIDALVALDFPLFWDALRHLVLPGVVLGWLVLGIISRLVRASLIEVLSQDYVRTARAKGLTETRVIVTHALRGALIPVLTIIGLSFASLIAGAVLTESIFAWPGIGSYAVEAARTLDFPAIMGVSIFVGAAYIVTNLVTDVAYALVDPRVRLS